MFDIRRRSDQNDVLFVKFMPSEEGTGVSSLGDLIIKSDCSFRFYTILT
jgi:hypothetical protein